MNLAGFFGGEKAGLLELSTFSPPSNKFFWLREFINRALNVKKKRI